MRSTLITVRLLFILSAHCLTASQPGLMNIADFGAISDGKTDATRAIQQAVDACEKRGGGRVLVPPGDFLTGPIWLKSHVDFHIEAGATLWATPDKGRYYRSGQEPDLETASRWQGLHCDYALINGDSLENVSISGRGRIHGQGSAYWWNIEKIRPYTIRLRNCRHVRFEEITTVESFFHTFQFHNINGLWIRGISLINDLKSPNTDGLHIFGCENVHISEVYISTGDDCILFGGGTRNATVMNSTFKTLWGVVWPIDCRDIVFTGCTVHCQMLIKDIKKAEHMIFSDIVCTGPGRLFSMMGGPVKNLMITNILAHGFYQAGWMENGEDVLLDNIRILREPGGHGEGLLNGFEFRDMRRLTLRDVTIQNTEKDPALVCTQTEGLILDGFNATGLPDSVPVVLLDNVRNALIQRCSADSGALFLALEGDAVDHIRLAGNDFQGIRVQASSKVPDAAVSSVRVRYSNLDCEPQFQADHPLSVSAHVTNIDHEAGLCAVPLIVNEKPESRQWLWLEPGESRKVVFASPQYHRPGDYRFTIGDLRPVKRKLPPSPARLTYSHLSTDTDILRSGHVLHVACKVKNRGGRVFSDAVTLIIDAMAADTQTISVNPGEEKEISFRIELATPGLHAVAIGDHPPIHVKVYASPLESDYLNLTFDDTDDDRITDHSGLGYHARLGANPGGEMPVFKEGPKGKGLKFNGESGFAVIPKMLFRFPMTFSFWVKPGRLTLSSTAGRQMILYAGIPKGNDGYGPEPELHFMRGTGDHLVFWGRGGLNLRYVIPDLERYYFVTVVYDTISRLYIDGKEAAAMPVRNPDFTGFADRIYIGRPTVDYLRYFNGELDELRFFNEALSPDEVKQLFGNYH